MEGGNINLIILKKLLNDNEKNFPNNQFGILFDIGSKKDNIIQHYLSNLKYNEKFNIMQTFNFQMKCNNENHDIYKEISEIIECNEKLNSVLIKLSLENYDPYADNPNTFEDVMFILNSLINLINIYLFI